MRPPKFIAPNPASPTIKKANKIQTNVLDKVLVERAMTVPERFELRLCLLVCVSGGKRQAEFVKPLDQYFELFAPDIGKCDTKLARR